MLNTLHVMEMVCSATMNDADWAELRRMHAGAGKLKSKMFKCPECLWPTHPRNCASGLRIFVHAAGHAQVCFTRNGESALHDGLKTLISRAINQNVKGWDAKVEQPIDGVDPNTGFPPRLDVLATNATTGQRFGFEVQLSPQTDAVASNRHEVRLQSMTECGWVVLGHKRKWAAGVPQQVIDSGNRGIPRVIDGYMESVTTAGYGKDFYLVPPDDPKARLDRMIKTQVLQSTRYVENVLGDGVGGWVDLIDLNAPVGAKAGRLATVSRPSNGSNHCDRIRLTDSQPPQTLLGVDISAEPSTSMDRCPQCGAPPVRRGSFGNLACAHQVRDAANNLAWTLPKPIRNPTEVVA